MTDENTPVTTPEGDALAMRVEPVGLETEMQRSYLDYAMSVIVSRALPDVRDGLKPVHRRVLYAMYDGGYRPERGFYKCARVVGDVMGNYHPHGDSSIYDALVRLAQSVVDADAARRLQRQLRLPGQRPGGGHALHRVQDGAAVDGDGPRHRRGDRRLHGQLRRPLPGADRPAGPLPEPADQRLGRYRGRHGDQHPAAQPARGRCRCPVVPGEPRGLARGAAGRAASSASRAPTSRPARSSSAARASRRRTAPAAAPSPCARSSRSRRSRTASAWWSRNCRTRSTRTTSRRRSPTW